MVLESDVMSVQLWADVYVAFAILTVLAAFRLLLSTLHFVYVYFVRPPVDPKHYGAWAVVTGASEGIGRAYADLLAGKGINLVLVALPEPCLEECASELKSKYGVRTRTVPIDLSNPTASQTLRAAVDGLEVGIWINNAGLFYKHPDFLESIPDTNIENIVVVNSLVPTMLCHVILPMMTKSRSGIIVNTGSATANAMPEGPLLAAYSASKAYIDSLSRSLYLECASSGIHVQNLWPMTVATKMPGVTKATLVIPSPTEWAAAAMRHLGRSSSITPYWVHALLYVGLQLAPKTGRKTNTRIVMELREKAMRENQFLGCDPTPSPDCIHAT